MLQTMDAASAAAGEDDDGEQQLTVAYGDSHPCESFDWCGNMEAEPIDWFHCIETVEC